MHLRAVFFLPLILLGIAAAQVSKPAASEGETDAGRYAYYNVGILQRTYDVAGQKSEWVLGTSILGSPDLDRTTAGISGVSMRFPGRLSGIYTTELTLDEFHPGLNGENGIMREDETLSPLDTPEVSIVWDRGAFSGNALKLEFKRQLVDSLRLDLGFLSVSNSGSDEYTYSAVVNQPFFALGRDSSQVPFGGRNIKVGSTNFRPAVTWQFPYGELMLRANLLYLRNDDASRFLVIQDTADYSLYHYADDTYPTAVDGKSYEAKLALHPMKRLTVGGSILKGSYDISYDDLPETIESIKDTILEEVDSIGEIVYDTTLDTTWYQAEQERKYETVSGTFFAEYAGFLKPRLYFEYEFLTADSKLEQDREIGYLELGERFGFFEFRALGGAQRNSSVNDEVDMNPTYAAEATFNLPFHLRLSAMHRFETRYPEVEELRLTDRSRLSYPNNDLKPEERTRSKGELAWDAGGVFYALGISREEAKEKIGERWLANSGLSSAETAYQLVNLGNVESYDWTMRFGFKIWNWSFYAERGAVLDRSARLMNVPELYYKGSVVWKNRFVKNRLGVQIRFDMQWFGTRYDCAMIADSIAAYGGYETSSSISYATGEEEYHLEIVELEKYLTLDFEARMNIANFDLYARIENLNHSKYTPAAGYTPEGMRFMYGITWSFRN